MHCQSSLLLLYHTPNDPMEYGTHIIQTFVIYILLYDRTSKCADINNLQWELQISPTKAALEQRELFVKEATYGVVTVTGTCMAVKQIWY